MTREELIEIGKQLVNPTLSEAETDRLYDLFSQNVLHQNGANLFFYPEKYNARTTDMSKYKPTVEEVVTSRFPTNP